MEKECVGEMMVIAKGGGPKPKVSGDVKTQIAEKVKKGTYYCLRQIADMVKIRFCLVISESTVSRILKEFSIRKLKSGSLLFKADIPPYSPNLNLIERFWKYIKGELRGSFYDDFGAFCSRIDEIIANAKVETLITEKVQFFDDLKQILKYISEKREQNVTPEKDEKQAA